jgi:Trypsin
MLRGWLSLLPALALTVAFSAPAQAASTVTPLINGGETVSSPVIAPWAVLLNMQGSTSIGKCSGSIIDATHVITAAHCTFDENKVHWAEYAVTAGISEAGAGVSQSELQRRQVTAIRVEPGYVPGAFGDDVAILQVDAPFDLGRPGVRSIAIVGQNGGLAVGSPVRLFGWGLVAPGVADGHEHSLEQTLLYRWQCTSGIPSMLCARTSSGSACPGDSGGGLVTTGVPPVLLGVDNIGIGSLSGCTAGDRDGYADLATPEISQWLAGNETPPLAPRTSALATMSGPQKVGSLLTCKAPGWSGAPTVGAAFLNEDTERVIQEGSSIRHRLNSGDVGHFLSCVSIASNAGGTTEATAAESVLITGTVTELIRVRSRKHHNSRWQVGLTVAPGLRGKRVRALWTIKQCDRCRRARWVTARRYTRLTSPSVPGSRRATLTLRLPWVEVRGTYYDRSDLQFKLPAGR